MELYSSGTHNCTSGIYKILDDVVLPAGVYMMDLDLSNMLVGSDIYISVRCRVQPSDTDKVTMFEKRIKGIQVNGKWQSDPIVCPATTLMEIRASNNWGTPAISIPWKFFKMATPTSVAASASSFTTGGSQSVSNAAIGTYVFMLSCYAMVAGDRVKVVARVGSRIVEELFMAHWSWPDMLMTSPIVADSGGIEITVEFENLSGATLFSWNLMRVA